MALAVTAGVPATANPWVDANQVAFASWTEKGGRTRAFYGMIGIREVDEDGSKTLGIPLKGTCRKQVTRDGASIICIAEGQAVSIPDDQFTVHPLLEDATIRVATDAYTHRVGWTGTGPHPHITANVSHSETRAYAADGGLVRSARAAGRVFGRRVERNSRFDLAGMGQSVSAFYVGPVEGLDIDIDSAGHTRVRQRFPLD